MDVIRNKLLKKKETNYSKIQSEHMKVKILKEIKFNEHKFYLN